MRSKRTPSPAMVVALVALFVSLSGTAVAAGVVPLAKRALVADNAKKLGGKTAAQVASQAAAMPGPASSAGGLVTSRTQAFSLAAGDGRAFTTPCAAGEKAISGGFTYEGGFVMASDSTPTANQAGWEVYLFNVDDADASSGSLQAICVK